jgi:hypothetical protein
MSQSPKRGAVTYEAETLFGENVGTTAALRLSVVGSVDCSGLKHNKIDSDRVTMRRNELTPWILGTHEGTFKTRLYLTGHGSSVQGATSASGHETLFGYIFGNAIVSSATGTTGTGGTATSITTAAANGFAAGSIAAVGVQGDGRGNGQPAVISSHSGSAATLLTAIDAACTGTDLVKSGTMVYGSESPTATTITGLRFLLQTSNLQYLCHGCVATNVSFSSLKTKQVAYIDVTWTVAWWEYKANTFPSAVATETFQPAPIAGGSLFMNTVGTATRVKYTIRDFTLDYKLGVELLEGPGGVSPYQTIVGAVRIPDEISLKFTADADAATVTPVLPALATGTNQQHILYGLNPTEQKSIAFYWPNVFTDDVAIQFMDGNVNRLRYSGRAGTGTTLTSELTMSAQRMYVG